MHLYLFMSFPLVQKIGNHSVGTDEKSLLLGQQYKDSTWKRRHANVASVHMSTCTESAEERAGLKSDVGIMQVKLSDETQMQKPALVICHLSR